VISACYHDFDLNKPRICTRLASASLKSHPIPSPKGWEKGSVKSGKKGKGLRVGKKEEGYE
jgi:hypothetical protein